jgi:hypothetical protein
MNGFVVLNLLPLRLPATSARRDRAAAADGPKRKRLPDDEMAKLLAEHPWLQKHLQAKPKSRKVHAAASSGARSLDHASQPEGDADPLEDDVIADAWDRLEAKRSEWVCEEQDDLFLCNNSRRSLDCKAYRRCS